ncbi:MAG: spermidine/putrescine ABC transporter substrate-binding protein, partial [Oscillospiraceae bacterium]|nr:spermidine/putrescine ABC transporter substrate-binding protein [Oscillospiraceae bacterium]
MKKIKLISLILVVAMVLALVTGCGGSKESETGYAKEIYLYNWSEYMLPEVLQSFEEEYGIKVIETTFESNDEMFAKLLAGNNGEYDIAVPSNFYIEAMLDNDLLEELDMSVMTNMDNLDEAYRHMSYDPEGKYTVPYMGTVALWLGNTKKLAELGVSANNYQDLEDPRYENNILFTDDTQGNINCGLVACDLDPLSTDPDDINAAKEWLIGINKNVKAYGLPDNVRDCMIRNEVAAAYMYSGNVLQA